jgi:hypothetical protein
VGKIIQKEMSRRRRKAITNKNIKKNKTGFTNLQFISNTKPPQVNVRLKNGNEML